jgi:UDP-N-acetyl-D-mannosaminuronic acid dehydrogenase
MNKEQYDVAVVGGAGHVGLPLSLILADKGFKVCIYDKNQAALDVIGQGRMPFLEEGALDLLVRNLNSNLFLSSDPACLREAHFVIVVIGTPVDEHLNPEFTLMQKSFTELLPFLKDGQHVILRSTLFPGTAEKVYKFLQAHGLNIRVSFCPERILQGKSLQEIKELPQIISGFDAETIQEASELFKKIADEVIALEPIEAEIAKLMTNCWRYIQFATANQFYVIAADRGLDFYKIFEAVKYKYPRMNGLPSAGFAAGPCLLKDTMQLAAFSGNNFALGQSAMFINEGLPNFITQQLKHKHDLSNKTVGILGMAFKPNCDDKRESLSYKLKKIFTLESKEVLCSDVYIREEGFVPADELIRRSDIIILATPHKEYKALIDSIGNEKTLVDVWNFYGQGKKSQSMPKQKILVTGSAGFIAGYLIEELLNQGYEVVGIDNYSKYGPVEKSYDHHPNYHFVQGDVKDTDLMKKLISDCDQLVALAAMIGGISYFHEYAYDLLAENERIIASTFDAAIWAWRNKKLKKINVLSSSMVFENTDVYPTSEGEQKNVRRRLQLMVFKN